jgi:hypothetical protein
MVGKICPLFEERRHEMIFLLVIALLMKIIGLILFFISLGMQTSAHPGWAFWKWQKKWVWWWDQKEWYTPKGFRYYIIGIFLFSEGCLISAIYWFCKWQGGVG